MLGAVMKWFEGRLESYPSAEPEQPPTGLLPFILHYVKGAKRWFALMVVLTAAVAIAEARCGSRT